MKKNVIVLLFGLLISCTNNNDSYNIPREVNITGKIENIDPNNHEIALFVNRLGFNQTPIYITADSLGNFQTSFETYTPTDIWLSYKTNFIILVQPGDSIYVEFDGQLDIRYQTLETIKFSGDNAKANQDAAKFQVMYYSDPLFYDRNAKEQAIKKYNANQYLQYLDTIKQRVNNIYEKFLIEVVPDNNVEIWAKLYIDQEYYDALSRYTIDYIRTNNLGRSEWTVPNNFYDTLLTRLPIEKNMFISGYALSDFVNGYSFLTSVIWDEEQNKQNKTQQEDLNTSKRDKDSLIIYRVINNTSDALLKQIVLTDLFAQYLEHSDIDFYEKYIKLADEYILEPFLREPLKEQYIKVKNLNENPEITTKAYLEKLKNTSVEQLIDSILTTNKGKVIYIDCWATWCSPCREEMPHSKMLMEELNNEDIVYVFLCIDSEKHLWENSLAEFQLGGQHHFLTNKQSNDLRKALDVKGVPHYFLINKDGIIVEKGSHLRPNNVKAKLLELLEK